PPPSGGRRALLSFPTRRSSDLIRAIEQATGVDLIIDDTPEAIIISCFNPIRREIAKIAIGRLVADGRIHHARIEETVQRVEQELDRKSTRLNSSHLVTSYAASC